MSVYTIDYGHALRGSVGARGNGYLEEVETRKIGKLVTQKLRSLGHTVHEIYLDDAVDMATDLNYRVNKINSIKPDMSVSIHLNAYKDASANGVEVWSDKYVWNTAANICAEISSSLGVYNRGVKDGTDSLALVGLYGGSTPALLVECVFITNAGDMAKYDIEKISTAIVKGITGETVSESTNNQPIKEEKKVKNIVIYSSVNDFGSAKILADFLQCPMIDNGITFDFSVVERDGIYAVGGSTSMYTSYLYPQNLLAGSDRYETYKTVLKKIGKL